VKIFRHLDGVKFWRADALLAGGALSGWHPRNLSARSSVVVKEGPAAAQLGRGPGCLGIVFRMEIHSMGNFSLFGLLILIADIWAIMNTVQSRATTGSKVLWTAIVLVFPVLGFIVWLLFGPKNEA